MCAAPTLKVSDSPGRPGVEAAFRWLGGAIFVGALTYCAYSYLITWARPSSRYASLAPDDLYRDLGPTLVRALDLAGNILLFAVFAIHHSIFARPRVKAWLASFVPEPLIRSVYVWTA